MTDEEIIATARRIGMSYFRVQDDRRDVNELLDPGYHFSTTYDRVTTRRGVSTCTSLEELAEYLASGQAGAIMASIRFMVIVELAGELSEDSPVDAGEALVIPTAIVAVRPVDDEFIDMIAAKEAWLAEMCPDPSLDWDD